MSLVIAAGMATAAVAAPFAAGTAPDDIMVTVDGFIECIRTF